jgi:membrane protein required for colicin V production
MQQISRGLYLFLTGTIKYFVIDIVFYCVVVLAIIQGFRKGFVMALFSLLCLLVGMAAAVKLSAMVAEHLGREPGLSGKWLPVLCFIGVFLIVALLVQMLGKLLESALKLVMLGWLNRLGGILLYLVLYTAVYSIVLYYGSGMHLISKEAVADSRFYGSVAPMAPKMIGWIALVIPFGKDMFEALKAFFDAVGRSMR